jgi:hypothetical protein
MITIPTTRPENAARGKESDLVKSIIDLLHTHGWLALRINSGAMVLHDEKYGKRFVKLADKGTLDIIACSPAGQYCEIECKIWPNKPSDEQVQRLQDVEARGGLAILAYSMEDVLAHMRDHMTLKERRALPRTFVD